jgi:L-asparaginase II
MIDYEIDKIFDLSSEEIALCCASHAGEKCHTDIAERLLKNFGLKYTDLKCGIHKPLSRTRQDEMFLMNEPVQYFHNNCVGKHLLFLALCKVNGWDLKTYDDKNSPLQQLVKTKINSLCEVNMEYPITKDGCGVPILSMPLKNMLKGFINLFSNEKYIKLKKAFLENPYIIGGENRLDTEIMENSKGLIAKVGAGGLCIVINPNLNDGIIVKIIDSNMETRRLVVFEALNLLGWSDYKVSKDIKTLHDEIVGEIKVNIGDF